MRRVLNLLAVAAALMVVCTFSYGSAISAESDDASILKTALEKFEKDGFGIKSVTNQREAVGTSIQGESLLRTLSQKSQHSALAYLTLPASGTWSGKQVDQAYDKFMRSVDSYDNDSVCYHLIRSTYLLGKEQYFDALQELTIAHKKDPGWALLFQLGALIDFKIGKLSQAQKNWDRANYLLSHTTGTASNVTWVSGVVFKIRRNWDDQIRKSGSKNLFHPTIIIIATIDKDGKVIDTKITQSSGDLNQDQLAQDACLQSSPVEPPPPGLTVPLKMQINLGKIVHHNF